MVADLSAGQKYSFDLCQKWSYLRHCCEDVITSEVYKVPVRMPTTIDAYMTHASTLIEHEQDLNTVFVII